MKLTANFLTTAYKPKTLKLKLDEDPLHCRIHFLTFIESLEMIYSQYKETCEVIHYHTTIRGGDIEDYVNKATRNLLHENIYVHSRRLIAKITGDGVKRISKLQSHFADMPFSDKNIYDRIFQQVAHKGGESAMNFIKRFQNAQALSVSVGNSYSED